METSYMTFEEASKLEGFSTPYEVKSDLSVRVLDGDKIKEMAGKGPIVFIDNDKRLYMKLGEYDYRLFIGDCDDGYVLSKQSVQKLGLSLDTLAKVMVKRHAWDNERFMTRFKERMFEEHIKPLEEAGLIKPTIMPLTYEMAREIIDMGE